MRSIGKLSVLGAVAALSACGAAEPRAGVAAVGAEQCFFTRQVNGFEVIDEETVNIRVSVNDVYQLDLVTPCTGIDWESRVAIESRGGNRIWWRGCRTDGGPCCCGTGTRRSCIGWPPCSGAAAARRRPA